MIVIEAVRYYCNVIFFFFTFLLSLFALFIIRSRIVGFFSASTLRFDAFPPGFTITICDNFSSHITSMVFGWFPHRNERINKKKQLFHLHSQFIKSSQVLLLSVCFDNELKEIFFFSWYNRYSFGNTLFYAMRMTMFG